MLLKASDVVSYMQIGDRFPKILSTLIVDDHNALVRLERFLSNEELKSLWNAGVRATLQSDTPFKWYHLRVEGNDMTNRSPRSEYDEGGLLSWLNDFAGRIPSSAYLPGSPLLTDQLEHLLNRYKELENELKTIPEASVKTLLDELNEIEKRLVGTRDWQASAGVGILFFTLGQLAYRVNALIKRIESETHTELEPSDP